MSLHYSAVAWNGDKKRYDLLMGLGVVAYLGTFIGAGVLLHPNATAETLLIRGFGTLAFLTLHGILAIGPLCRLAPRFLPLLYNRRHLGVTMFLVALTHGLFSLIQFHSGGDRPALLSLLTSSTSWTRGSAIPFQLFGLVALLILFSMAATSHDFWLKLLTPRVWKALHMMVYAAYALIFLHVCFGALQSERSPVYAVLAGAGMAVLAALHLMAARVERAAEREAPPGEPYVEVCGVNDIPEKRARIVMVSGERVAVFRYDGKISAVSNVCEHQNGPLGEGKIVAGCITCPWHGYQYLPDTGASPPPFTEKIATFPVRVLDGRVLVHPTALPPGTRVEPARIGGLCGK
jgi:nitrite reductase/ring-hydroxylating ferredoxin subunit/DMSO/TMAO reductase YedYZ heme-binding membrane subunit